MKRRSFVARFLAWPAGAAALATLNPSNAQTGGAKTTVTVGVVTVAAPFSYLKDNKHSGISNDILQRVAQLENFQINYVPLKFDALIPAIQAGQIDIAVSGIFVTEARKKIVDFSTPYFVQGGIVVAPANSSIKGVEDLKGKTLACEQGSAALNIARENAQAWGVTLRIFPDPANMQLAMRTGDVDAMIYDSGIVAHQMRVEGKSPTIKAISEVLKPTGIAFAFPKDSKMVAVVDRGIAKMEAAGEIAQIKKSYNME
jgi:ABC-type amino acid transport substrate-binding protein